MRPPEWLRPPMVLPEANEATVGVAIGVSHAPTLQLHVGIVHSDVGLRPHVLHLAFHHDTRNEELPDNPRIPFWWVRLDVFSAVAEDLAARCRLIARRVERGDLRIPYGLVYEGGRIRDDGRTEFAGREIGFTCATFVLAVLEGVGISLIDRQSWPLGRPGDGDWRDRMIVFLERVGASPVHVDGVRAEPDWPRYRPEEIAAAFQFTAPRNLSFAAVHPGSRQIAATLLPGT